MSDDRSTFEVTKARLEDIVVQVRRKDVSLEQSLDMLEEAVRLVNQCNELIDQTSFKPTSAEAEIGADTVPEAAGSPDGVLDVVQVVEIVSGTAEGAAEIVETADAIEGEADSWGAVDAWDEVPQEPAVDDDARE